MAETLRKAPVAVDRDGLRELLVEQYALHEFKHHPFAESREDRANAVTPRAHTLMDIYKCLHQGEFGPGHNIDNPVRAREGVARALSDARPTKDEPVLERVTPEGSVFRINVRPYKAIFDPGDEVKACDYLVQVFFESAAIQTGRIDRFRATLEEFMALNNRSELAVEGIAFKFPSRMVESFLKELDEFIRKMGSAPAFSHSKSYRYFNDPSYRVANLEVLKQSPLAFLLDQ